MCLNASCFKACFKVNELLKHQLKTSTQQRNSYTIDQSTINKLTEEVNRLKDELNVARQQSSSKNTSKIPSKTKSLPTLKSKLPVPVDKVSKCCIVLVQKYVK